MDILQDKTSKPRFSLKSVHTLSIKTNTIFLKIVKKSSIFSNSKFTFSKLPKRPCRIAALIVKFTK